jgi:hypothetical protein
MGKETCRRFIFLLPTIDFELGQSMKSTSEDDLGDWKSKFISAKEKFQVRYGDICQCDSFLNWFLPGKNGHKNSGRTGDCQSHGTLASGCR